MAYRNTDKPPKKIAQELKVKALVEASFLRSGERIRLTARLIDPFRDKIVWDGTIEKEAEDFQILEREFARAVVAAVKVAITPEEKALLAGGRKVDPEAYELLMKGIAAYWDLVDFDIYRAFEPIEKATEIDPDLALAHAWLAFLYYQLGLDSREDENAVYPKARKALDRAFELDGNIAMAHQSRGWLKFNDRDFAGAERDFKRALELAPGNAEIPLFYEAFLCLSGRAEEAVAELQRRREERTPVGLEEVYSLRQVYHFLWAGRYADALKELEKIPTQYFVAVARALIGSPTEAAAIMEKLMEHPENRDIGFLRKDHAWILALAGRRTEALKALEEHVALQAAKNIDTSFDEACVYAGLGDKDKAFELLTESYEKRSSLVLGLVSDWCLHSLHGDPRFEELARKIGFPVIPNVNAKRGGGK